MEKEKKEFLQKEQDLKAEIEKLCEKGRRYQQGKEKKVLLGGEGLAARDGYLIKRKRMLVTPSPWQGASAQVCQDAGHPPSGDAWQE